MCSTKTITIRQTFKYSDRALNSEVRSIRVIYVINTKITHHKNTPLQTKRLYNNISVDHEVSVILLQVFLHVIDDYIN